MREAIERLFPRLTERSFEITSPSDRRYNCVAWAASDMRRWWWPGEPPFSFWPDGVRRDESIHAFSLCLGRRRSDAHGASTREWLVDEQAGGDRGHQPR
jgi:hypothetical protein